jgi:hypothetical protein
MTNVWPGTLPQQLLLNGASLGVGDGLVEYQPDRGRRSRGALERGDAAAVGQHGLEQCADDLFETFFYTTLMAARCRSRFRIRAPAPPAGEIHQADAAVLHAAGRRQLSAELSLMVLP